MTPEERIAELERELQQTRTWLAEWQGHTRDAAERERELREERDRYLSVLKEYEEADFNHGLAEEQLTAANDRAERLYMQWRKEGEPDELMQRRRENSADCMRLGDVASCQRRRKDAARKAIRDALNDAALAACPPSAGTEPQS